jgi:hypothetical protein
LLGSLACAHQRELVRVTSAHTECAPTVAICGVVLDDSTHLAIAGAWASLVGTGHQAFADSSGRFAIVALSPGRYRLQVAFIGYKPLRRDLQLSNVPLFIRVRMRWQTSDINRPHID